MFSQKVMIRTITAMTLAFMLIGHAQAVEKETEITKSEPTSILNYLKDKFTANYHGEYGFRRRDIESANEEDHKIQDLGIFHNPTVTYTPVKNYTLLVSSEFKYADTAMSPGFINRHYRSLVIFTRENVLEEKESGVRLDLGVARRIMDRNHGQASSYGNSRLRANLSKKFGDKLSSSLLIQYMANDPVKAEITPERWRHALNLLPSLTFQITDKITYLFNDDFAIYTPWNNDTEQSTTIEHEMNVAFLSYKFNNQHSSYFQFKYLHSEATAFHTANTANDSFEYYIGHSYSPTAKLTLTAEIGSTLAAGGDGRDFFAKGIKYPEATLYLDYTL